jgi:hypothetical protein
VQRGVLVEELAGLVGVALKAVERDVPELGCLRGMVLLQSDPFSQAAKLCRR